MNSSTATQVKSKVAGVPTVPSKTHRAILMRICTQIAANAKNTTHERLEAIKLAKRILAL
jgi:hypothetical protein